MQKWPTFILRSYVASAAAKQLSVNALFYAILCIDVRRWKYIFKIIISKGLWWGETVVFLVNDNLYTRKL